jgi:hypothetical protein
MEKADSNKELSTLESNVVVSTVLKVEIVLAVLFLSDETMDKAILLGAACAFVNQFTEMYYLKKTTMRSKLLVLFKSILVTLFFYLVAYSSGVDFFLHRHGQTSIDTYKLWLLVKVLVFLFVFLAAERLLAVGADCLIKRLEQNRKLRKYELTSQP